MSDLVDNDRDSILASLGLTDTEYLAEAEMPAVDDHRLRLLVENLLDTDDSLATCRLIASYRSWHEAYAKLIGERSSSAVEGEKPTGSYLEFSERAVRTAIDLATAPYRSGQLQLSDCDLVAIVRNVEAKLFGDTLSLEHRRRFYEVAVDCVDELLIENALKSKKLGAVGKKNAKSAETVSSDTLETTFVSTARDAKRLLGRHEEIDKLKDVFPDEVQYYRLARFVGEDEISKWFDVDSALVKKRRKFISAKLAQAESRR